MLRIEQQYETPNESNYYQNYYPNTDPQEQRNSQENTNHTPHIIENNSSMNNIYQNTKNKISPPQKKLDNSTRFGKFRKQIFSTADLEIDFLINFGAE